MKFAYTRNTVAADFLTVGYRISCRVGVPAGGLHVLLIDPLNSYLELEDAYISRINNPGEIVAHYGNAALRKDNILFIILARREDGDTPKGTGSFLKPVPKQTFLTVPSFEIRGTVETEANAGPREILVQTAGRFIPLYKATAATSLSPKNVFSGKLILVNKEKVEAFCIAED